MKIINSRLILRLCCLFFLGLSGLCASTAAAEYAPLHLETGQAHYLNITGRITRLAVANPKIAGAVPISGHVVMVVPKAPGSTSLSVWSGALRQDFILYVNGSQNGLSELINEAAGTTGITAFQSGNTILLKGTVKNQYQKNLAEKIASLYDKKVINLLEMSAPAQVRIAAQIIEINSTDAQNLGLQFFSSNNASSNPYSSDLSNGNSSSKDVTFNSAGDFSLGQNFNNSHYNSHWILNHTADINATLHLLVTEGKAKVLSRPNIATLSGQKASILIGGEIPIPMKGDNGDVSINWHKYGISLDIDPIINPNNSITSKIHASVSSLDYAHAVVTNGFSVPAIASREAQATINVPSGMTMAIGGLLNSNDSKTVEKVPFLSELPIIGEFFKHTIHSSDSSEIVILITPTIVNPDTPIQMSPDMRDWYDKEQLAQKRLPKVNVNAPIKSNAMKRASENAISPDDDTLNPNTTNTTNFDGLTAEEILARLKGQRKGDTANG